MRSQVRASIGAGTDQPWRIELECEWHRELLHQVAVSAAASGGGAAADCCCAEQQCCCYHQHGCPAGPPSV